MKRGPKNSATRMGLEAVSSQVDDVVGLRLTVFTTHHFAAINSMIPTTSSSSNIGGINSKEEEGHNICSSKCFSAFPPNMMEITDGTMHRIQLMESFISQDVNVQYNGLPLAAESKETNAVKESIARPPPIQYAIYRVASTLIDIARSHHSWLVVEASCTKDRTIGISGHTSTVDSMTLKSYLHLVGVNAHLLFQKQGQPITQNDSSVTTLHLLSSPNDMCFQFISKETSNVAVFIERFEDAIAAMHLINHDTDPEGCNPLQGLSTPIYVTPSSSSSKVSPFSVCNPCHPPTPVSFLGSLQPSNVIYSATHPSEIVVSNFWALMLRQVWCASNSNLSLKTKPFLQSTPYDRSSVLQSPYMSPQMYASYMMGSRSPSDVQELPADHTDDIWSVGVMVLEWLLTISTCIGIQSTTISDREGENHHAAEEWSNDTLVDGFFARLSHQEDDSCAYYHIRELSELWRHHHGNSDIEHDKCRGNRVSPPSCSTVVHRCYRQLRAAVEFLNLHTSCKESDHSIYKTSSSCDFGSVPRGNLDQLVGRVLDGLLLWRSEDRSQWFEDAVLRWKRSDAETWGVRKGYNKCINTMPISTHLVLPPIKKLLIDFKHVIGKTIAAEHGQLNVLEVRQQAMYIEWLRLVGQYSVVRIPSSAGDPDIIAYQESDLLRSLLLVLENIADVQGGVEQLRPILMKNVCDFTRSSFALLDRYFNKFKESDSRVEAGMQSSTSSDNVKKTENNIYDLWNRRSIVTKARRMPSQEHLELSQRLSTARSMLAAISPSLLWVIQEDHRVPHIVPRLKDGDVTILSTNTLCQEVNENFLTTKNNKRTNLSEGCSLHDGLLGLSQYLELTPARSLGFSSCLLSVTSSCYILPSLIKESIDYWLKRQGTTGSNIHTSLLEAYGVPQADLVTGQHVGQRKSKSDGGTFSSGCFAGGEDKSTEDILFLLPTAPIKDVGEVRRKKKNIIQLGEKTEDQSQKEAVAEDVNSREEEYEEDEESADEEQENEMPDDNGLSISRPRKIASVVGEEAPLPSYFIPRIRRCINDPTVFRDTFAQQLLQFRAELQDRIDLHYMKMLTSDTLETVSSARPDMNQEDDHFIEKLTSWVSSIVKRDNIHPKQNVLCTHSGTPSYALRIRAPLIPASFRAHCWAKLLGLSIYPSSLRKSTIDDPYHAVNTYHPTGSDRQIAVDIPRCHQYHHLLASSEGHRKLMRVIKAWLYHSPGYVYWQGVDSIAAILMSVSFHDEALTAAALGVIIDKYVPHYFRKEGAGTMEQRLLTFHHTLQYVDPDIAMHLESIECKPELFSISWFLTLFAHVLPAEKIYLLWDRLFQSGESSFCVCIAVALVSQLRNKLSRCDFSETVTILSTTTLQETIDVGLAASDASCVFDHIPLSILRPTCVPNLKTVCAMIEASELSAAYKYRLCNSYVVPSRRHWSDAGVFLLDIRSNEERAAAANKDHKMHPLNNIEDKTCQTLEKHESKTNHDNFIKPSTPVVTDTQTCHAVLGALHCPYDALEGWDVDEVISLLCHQENMFIETVSGNIWKEKENNAHNTPSKTNVSSMSIHQSITTVSSNSTYKPPNGAIGESPISAFLFMTPHVIIMSGTDPKNGQSAAIDLIREGIACVSMLIGGVQQFEVTFPDLVTFIDR